MRHPHLIPLRHDKLEVGSGQADLEVGPHEAQIGSVPVQSVNTDYQVEAGGAEQSVLVRDEEVWQ